MGWHWDCEAGIKKELHSVRRTRRTSGGCGSEWKWDRLRMASGYRERAGSGEGVGRARMASG